MPYSRIRNAIKHRINLWRLSGDDAPDRLMRIDAFEHLRWQIGRTGSIEAAIIRMEDAS